MFKKKTKIFVIADLHLGFKLNKSMEIFGAEWTGYLDKISKDWHKKVNKNDIVLIPGDISWAMKIADVQPDLDWIASHPGKKVMIRGNHDYWWSSRTAVRKLLDEKMYAIDNDSVKLDGFIFCGTRGWSVPERKDKQDERNKKIYNREVHRLELSIKDAISKRKSEKLIAMVHYPPFNGQLDDSEFTQMFEKYGIKTVVYGHIHGNNSKSVMEHKKNGVKYYLTSCDKLEHKLKRIY